MARIFLRYGARVNARNAEGKTPLQVLLQIIESKAKHYTRNYTAGHYYHTLEVLIKDGAANVNITDQQNQPFLHLVVREHFGFSRDRLLPLMINAGADLNIRDSRGRTVLHVLSEFGFYRVNPSILRTMIMFLEAGANINATDSQGQTPLHYSRNLNMTRMLIERGANINATDSQGQTPLHKAVRSRNSSLVTLLLGAGTSVQGISLFEAIRVGSIPLVEKLIESGADVNARDSQTRGQTLLQYTITLTKPNIRAWEASLKPEIIEKLLNADASIEGISISDAVRSRSPELVQRLIQDGADVNARDASGRTPLQYALLIRNNHRVLQILLDNGASVQDQELLELISETSERDVGQPV